MIAGNQTICSDDDPVAFTSPTDGDGDGTITYRWELSTNMTTPTWSTIALATSATYDADALSQDAQYRRVTISTKNSVPCEAISTVLSVIVNNLTAGSIAGSQTICSGADPVAFTVATAATADGTITYRWELNTNLTTASWSLIGSATGSTYDPGVLTADAQYRRVTISTLPGKACEATSNVLTITVNPLPTPTISGSTSVTEGSTVVYSTPNVSGHTYSWSVTGGTYVVSPAYVCEVTWGSGNSGSVQVIESITATGCNKTESVSVTITPIALKGTITYKNAANTPMGNVTVSLLGAGDAILGSTTTSPTGYYQFATMPAGTVAKIQVSTAKAWGGGNSTDALAISRISIGVPISFWNPVNFLDKVGDVNGSNIVNSTDALLVKRRAIQLVSSFSAGDWCFSQPNANPANPSVLFTNTLANTAWSSYNGATGTTINIQAMCYGDVNGSFTPSASKNSIAVLSDSVINIGSGQVFELPVKIENSMDLSALTLYLNYASDKLEVIDVKSDLTDLMFNVKDGSINMAWSEIQPVSIADRGKLITLVLKSKATITADDELFTCNGISEFANEQGETIQPVNLVINRLDNTGAYGLSDNLAMEYGFTVSPNPFGSTAKIAVTLPEKADVKVTLLNSVGKTVSILADRAMDMGLNSWSIPAESLDLPNGVYFVHLQAIGKQSSCSRTLKVIHIK